MSQVSFGQEELEEVTITGSRIVRRDLSAPSPIMTVGSEAFENTASTGVESVLNQMPQFVPGGTQFSSSIQSGPTSSPGAATLNLRGLGSNRNLVLIDGRRAQPSNAALVVDINTIPASAIANVEVITGGASAVYGPDAMAGVVNFVLKNNFEGVELDFQTGGAAEGDGVESRVSLLMGLNSADGRGNIMIGADWTRREPIMQIDREFFRNGWLDPNNAGGQFMQPSSYGAGESAIPGGRNLPSQAAVNSLFPQVPPGTVGNSSEFRFNPDGSIFVTQAGLGYKGPLNCLADCGSFTGIKKLTNGNLDQINTNAFLQSPLERHSMFLKGNYDVSDKLNVFVQGNYSNISVDQRGGIPPAITVWQAPIPRDGRAIPGDLNTLLDARANPAGHWSLYRVLDFNGPIETKNTSNVWQLMVGVGGELMDGDWSWEAYVSRGDTSIAADNQRLPSLQRYQYLVSQKDFGQGRGFVQSGRTYGANCETGFPIFKDFVPPAECVENIDMNMINSSKLTQEIAEANLQGGLFDTYAGEVRFAAGISRRENTYQYQPGNTASAIIENPVGLFASNATGGAVDVSEIYGELLVPVLGETDIPLIQNIDLELGYRFSDFSTAGGTETYKALFTWGATDTVAFRGGYQFATRAPNVAELFSAPSLLVVPFPDVDPCSAATLSPWGNVPSNPDRLKVQGLCRAIIGNDTSQFDTQTFNAGTYGVGPNGFTRQNPPFFPLEIEIVQGNPKVGPEEGKTYTIGAVVTEPFGLENLSITVDAYRIQIADTISPISSITVYNNCFNFDGASNPSYDINNEFCQLIGRNDSTGDRAQVDALYSNLGSLETQGIDLQVTWSKDIGPGVFAVNSSLNYLDSFEYQPAPTDAIVNATGTLDQGGLYDFRTFTTFSYRWNDFNVGLNWRHLSSIENAAASRSPNTTLQGTGSYDMFNLTGGYNWGKYSLRVGVDNVLDENPVIIGANPGVDSNSDQTSPAFYDVVGRRYFIGVKASF